MDETIEKYFNQIKLKIDILTNKVEKLISQTPPITEQIKQLWQLMQDGALTQKEFDEQKMRLLQSTSCEGTIHLKMNDSSRSVGVQYRSRVLKEKHETEREVSGVPVTKHFIRPILQWASRQSREFTRSEAADAMADYFNLSPEAKNEITRGGTIRFYSNAGWAIWHLRCAGLLQQTGVGKYRITDEGRGEAFSSGEVMTESYLTNNFPSYQIEREWAPKNKNRSETSGGKPEVPAMTDFLRPILQWASGRSAEFTSHEAAEAMAVHFNLSDEARNELTRGGLNRVDNRINWSLIHLNAAELLTEPSEESCDTTQAGRDEAFASDERMTSAYLVNKFSAYQCWRNKNK